MTSQKKRDSNKRNAQSSKGPIDTSSTRLNALKHGILSKESFIAVGDGQEDAAAFEEFCIALTESFGPVGAIEELLVEKIIVYAWRGRRVIRYETAEIRIASDRAIEDWERTQKLSSLTGDGSWQSKEDLASIADGLRENLRALAHKDPIEAHPGIWELVFLVVSGMYLIDVSELLGLKEHWGNNDGFSDSDVRLVIASACEAAEITEEEFWQEVKKCALISSEELTKNEDKRRSEHELVCQSASLPIEASLNNIQRYEAHLSREFYKALHELQRLKAARLGYPPSVPLALDIEVDPGPLHGAE